MDGFMYRVVRWAYQPAKNVLENLRRALAAISRRRTVAKYLGQPGFKGLQVGCGPHRVESWLNSDLLENAKRDLFIDITKALPFPDGSLDAIYASEVIEHIPESAGRSFLCEAFRVLKPEGNAAPHDAGSHRDLRIVSQRESRRDDRPVWRGVARRGLHAGTLGQRAVPGTRAPVYLVDAGVVGGAARCGVWMHRAGRPRTTLSGLPELKQLERHYSEREPAWVFAPR